MTGFCFILVIVLTLFGLVMDFSASYAYSFSRYGDSFHYVRRQAIFALGGFAAMLVIMRFDYRWMRKATGSGIHYRMYPACPRPCKGRCKRRCAALDRRRSYNHPAFRVYENGDRIAACAVRCAESGQDHELPQLLAVVTLRNVHTDNCRRHCLRAYRA